MSKNEAPAGTKLVGANSPADLRERPQWVCWRFEIRDGKKTKIPYTALGKAASSTDPATWVDYETARAAAAFGDGLDYDGIGYVFSPDDPYTGIDFDDCLDGDRLHPAVATHLLTLDSFTEVSPSGTGVKTIVRASKNGFERCSTTKTPWQGKFECYDHARFWTITSAHLRGTPTTIEPRQGELERVLLRVFGKPDPPGKIPPRELSGAGLGGDDEELLARARDARNGDKFSRLWAGDTAGYGSASEADLALVSMLAFWVGPDPVRIDSLFRQSGLMREKWNREDYATRTIERALERGEFFNGDMDMAAVVAYLERAAGKPTAPVPQETVGRVRLRPLGSYEARAVEMLIPGHVPVGAPTLLSGVGGLGKSTLALGWGAKLSRGELGPAADTIYVSFEDTAAEVLLPRVQAAGGDPDRIHVVEFADGVDQVSLPRDIDVLRQLIHSVDARLLVVDPIMAALDLRLDSHKDQHVRVVMAQFRAIAEEARCALVSIGHLNKAPTTDGYLRVGGSPAFWNSARSVVLVTADPNEPDVFRLVSQLKANLARLAPVERWRIEDVDLGADPTGKLIRVPVLRFVEVADDIDASEVLGPRATTKTATAESWLAGILSDGDWHESPPLKALAEAAGISGRTVDRAADDLGVEKKHEGFPKKTFWALHPVPPNPPPKVGGTGDPAQPSPLKLIDGPVPPTSGDVA